MKRFAFRLQKLLDWRRQRKQAQSAVVARALADLGQQQGEMDALHGQHRLVKDGLRRQRAGVLNPQQVIRTEAFDAWIRRRVEEQAQRVQQATGALAGERDALGRMVRDEKLLERLRERREQQHRHQALRLEGHELDDIGSIRHQAAQAASEADRSAIAQEDLTRA